MQELKNENQQKLINSHPILPQISLCAQSDPVLLEISSNEGDMGLKIMI